jgi:hypothetical protein
MLTAQGRSRRTAPPEEFNESLIRCVAIPSREPLKADTTCLSGFREFCVDRRGQ